MLVEPPAPLAPPVAELPPVPEQTIVIQPPPCVGAHRLQLALQQYSLAPQTAEPQAMLVPPAVPGTLPPLLDAERPPVLVVPPMLLPEPPTDEAPPPPRLTLPLHARVVNKVANTAQVVRKSSDRRVMSTSVLL